MKLKLIQFMAAIMIVATAFVGMSSFVSSDEEETGKIEYAHPCEILCFPPGSTTPIIVVGHYNDCETVNFRNSCSPTDCIVSCPGF